MKSDEKPIELKEKIGDEKMDIEKRIAEELSGLLNGLAYSIIEAQKRKLRIPEGPLTVEQAPLLIEQIREACIHVAGESVADEIYERLIRLCNEQKEDMK